MRPRMIPVLMLALVLGSSLAHAGPESEVQGTTTPQYGGTFNYFLTVDAPSPAEADAAFDSLYWLDWIQERLIMGDIEKFGPRGTKEYTFQNMSYQPVKYWRGELLEGWEIGAKQIVMHVRKGVYWAPNEKQKAWMKAREFTADDLAADTIRFIKGPWGMRFKDLLTADGVKVKDKYTVVLELLKFSPSIFYYLAYEDRAVQAPPEIIAAGANKWENQVGTGPWMFEDFVPGTTLTLVKNPNYWKKTTIGGKEYKLPFVDRVVVSYIPDAATQLAAIATGRVDVHRQVPPTQWDALDKRASWLNKYLVASGETVYGFRCDEPPFNDVNVRRALTIGTNLDEFRKYGMATETPYVYNPAQPGDPAYIPLEQLPKDTQILYKYDPELAMKMLADAGYPKGTLKTSILGIDTTSNRDVMSLLKDQWARIGVELTLDPRESVEYTKLRYPLPKPAYHGVLLDSGGVHNPVTFVDTVCQSGEAGYLNYQVYANPKMDELVRKIDAEFDVNEQTRLLKEAFLIWQHDAARITLFTTLSKIYWTPWLKNYFGERGAQDDASGFAPIIAYAWIDEKLKKSMGH